MAGLYIHIPFCAKRCSYCGFYSTTRLNMRDKYVDSICKEMSLRRNYFSLPTQDGNTDNIIRTIYIGGGTPSQLSCFNLEKIFDAISAYSPPVDADFKYL